MTACLTGTINHQQTKKEKGECLIGKAQSLFMLFQMREHFLQPHLGFSLERPQNSFNEIGSVFVTATFTAADVFILFQWRNIKMYEYVEKNVIIRML